jgi:hypothetical protein
MPVMGAAGGVLSLLAEAAAVDASAEVAARAESTAVRICVSMSLTFLSWVTVFKPVVFWRPRSEAPK